jgi:hypothetical protein
MVFTAISAEIGLTPGDLSLAVAPSPYGEVVANEPSCPQCGSVQTIPISSGMPDHELFAASERGEVLIGGCILMGDDPDRHCVACGIDWVSGVVDPVWSLDEG